MKYFIETSIIIPTFNEVKYIQSLLDSLIQNAYPKEKLEILIFDGKSTDGTRAILEEYSRIYPFIKVFDNPKRLQVYALNLALNEVQGKYIIRCDAHAEYPKDYISRLVHFLENSDESIGNIGGQAIGVAGAATQEAEAIAIALSHPFGVGLSHRSITIAEPKEVDTVLFGAWKRKVFESVGGFDEHFVRGQDYEHNKRLIRAGYKVILIPELEFQYFTRDTFRKLARMVYQYAYAKTQIIKKYREPIRIRVIIPALFVLGIPVAFWFPMIEYGYLFYGMLSIGISFKAGTTIAQKMYLMVTFPLMHTAHGIGFIRGMIEQFILHRSKIEWESTR